jgi:hypothetical protein
MMAAKTYETAPARNSALARQAARALARPAITNIPLIWRLRLVLHGVRLSPFAYEDLTTAMGAGHVAWRVTMMEGELVGAEAAPLDARVNIRAASFVLRRFGLQVCEMRTDAAGWLLAIDAEVVTPRAVWPQTRAHLGAQ